MPTFFAGQTDYIEKLNDVDTATGTAQAAIDAHIADTTAAHAASAISNTPAGNIAATTVQAAINELDTEKLSASATTLPASFTASSLTSVGTLTALTVSGQASFAAGSAAAPGVKVGAEQNGLYSSAANTLDVTLNGVRQFQFGYTASAVNYLQATGSTTGNETRLRVQGSDTNAGMWLTTKGTGVIRMETGGGEQFRVSHAASAVNYWQAQGAATTGVPILFATGSDASVSGVYSTKGAGSHAFYTNSTTAPQFFVSHTTSSVNYLQVTGAATGNAVTISTGGSDTNRSIAITPAGTGTVNLGVTRVSGADGGIQFGVQGATRGVRFITSSFGSAIEGVDNTLLASYQPLNIIASNLGLYTVGSNNISFGTNSSVPQMYVSPNATAVNALVFTGGATGNAVTISTTGTDANRRISVTAGGTEGVLLGNATNGGIFMVGSFSGAEKTLYILNTTTAPTTNPPTGGYLYCEGGALKYRGSAGTITTIAAA